MECSCDKTCIFLFSSRPVKDSSTNYLTENISIIIRRIGNRLPCSRKAKVFAGVRDSEFLRFPTGLYSNVRKLKLTLTARTTGFDLRFSESILINYFIHTTRNKWLSKTLGFIRFSFKVWSQFLCLSKVAISSQVPGLAFVHQVAFRLVSSQVSMISSLILECSTCQCSNLCSYSNNRLGIEN